MEIFETLTQFVQTQHPQNDPSHDFLHILRVRKKCEEIGTQMGAKMDILIPAALLHDLVNVPKNHPQRAQAADLSAAAASKILNDLGVSSTQIEAILTTIREHSFSAGRPPSSLESAILQDADRLDSIGAIGIARTFSCGTLLGSLFYHPSEPFAQNRSLADKNYMLDHFYVKLVKLADLMNTPPAQAEAKKRAELMHLFLEQLKTEII